MLGHLILLLIRRFTSPTILEDGGPIRYPAIYLQNFKGTTGHDSGDLTAWVLAAQTGSRQACAKLIAHFHQDIERYLLVRTGAIEIASDLTQDTFVAVFERIKQLREPQAFAAWLFQIARNLWRMWVRRRTQRRFVSLDDWSEPAYFSRHLTFNPAGIEHFAEIDLVRQAFAELSPKSDRQ